MSPSASEPPASENRPRLDLSIIVVSYNTRDLLIRCLESVAASLASTPALRAETIVVDNASADGSAETTSERCPWARLIARTSNSGFAAASNEGIAASAGRIVLLLNPDTEVLGSALAEIVECFDRHPDAGIVGGHLLNPDGSEQESRFRFPGLAQQFLDFFPINRRLRFSRLNGRYPARLVDREHEIDHPLGACFAISREVVDAIGPLDAGFFMYCEEVDWALRARQAGWEAWYAPLAQVIHHGGAAARQVRGRMLVQLYRSRFRFWKKHHGAAFVWAARRIVHLGLSAESRRWRRENLRGELSDERLAELQAAARAVWALSPETDVSTVTGAVLARDEAGNISACLESLAWTDALLVLLDDRTTDDTASIAERHSARVVHRRFRDYASQRNAALAEVQTDWVFFLDADERVPAALATEMRGLVSTPTPRIGGYWVPRHNIIWGRRIDHGGWYPDYQLRLLRVAGARYDESREVHELVSVAGETGNLLHPLVHYNYSTVRQFLDKQGHYSTLEARSRCRRGERVRAYQLLRRPQREFFRRYFELEGRLDGLHGLMLCGLLAWYELVTLLKLIALRRHAAGTSAGG